MRAPFGGWGSSSIDHVRPQPAGRDAVRLAARAAGVLEGLGLPGDREHVAVRQRLDVVVREMFFAREQVVPHQLAVPGVLADSPALSATAEDLDVGLALGSQEVPVVEQVDGGARRAIARPQVDDLPVVVDQVGLVRHQRRIEDVAWCRARFRDTKASSLRAGLGRRRRLRRRRVTGSEQDENRERRRPD